MSLLVLVITEMLGLTKSDKAEENPPEGDSLAATLQSKLNMQSKNLQSKFTSLAAKIGLSK